MLGRKYEKKSIPLNSLKKKLWKIFSEYIRLRDSDEYGNVRCISCGSIRHWKDVHAGHYEKRGYLGTFVDERNVHGQCPRCNLYLNGNQSAYAIALRKKYGETILEELDKLKNSREKYTRIEYEELIDKYKKETQNLMARQKNKIYGAR